MSCDARLKFVIKLFSNSIDRALTHTVLIKSLLASSSCLSCVKLLLHNISLSRVKQLYEIAPDDEAIFHLIDFVLRRNTMITNFGINSTENEALFVRRIFTLADAR